MNRKPQRRALVAAGVMAVTAAVGAGTSSASTAKSTVSISFTAPSAFTGKVSSKQKFCVRRRVVQLVLYPAEVVGVAEPLRTVHQGPPPPVVGSTRTNKKGHWEIDLTPSQHGDYQANAKAKTNRDHSITCPQAVSDQIPL